MKKINKKIMTGARSFGSIAGSIALLVMAVICIFHSPAQADWTPANPSILGNPFIEADFTFSDPLYIGIDSGKLQLLPIVNFGWEDNSPAGASSTYFRSVSAFDANNIWVAGRNTAVLPAKGAIYRYNGTTWTDQSGEDLPENSNLYGISAADTLNAWAVGDGYGGGVGAKSIYHTANGGEDWLPQTGGIPAGTYLSLRGVFAVDDQHAWAVGWNPLELKGVIYYTSNGGTTWTEQTGGLASPTFYGVSAVNADNAWAVGDGYGGGVGAKPIYHTANGGEDWLPQAGGIPAGTYLSLRGVFAVDDQHAWAVGWNPLELKGVIYYTSNGGTTWTEQTGGLASIIFYGVSAVDDQHAWAVGTGGALVGGVIYYTSNGGTTWTEQTEGVTSMYFRGVSAVSTDNVWSTGEMMPAPATGKVYQGHDIESYSTTAVTATTPELLSSALSSDFLGWESLVITASGTDGGTCTVQTQYKTSASPDWVNHGTPQTISASGATVVDLEDVPVIKNGEDELQLIVSMQSDLLGTERCYDIDQLAVTWLGETPTPTPVAWISCPVYCSDSYFPVTWSSRDEDINLFNIQYKVGASGTWTTWLSDVTYLSANFGLDDIPPGGLTRDQTYYFQVQGANDVTETEWSEAANGTLIVSPDRTVAPTASISCPVYCSSSSFSVSWSSSDTEINKFDVDYKAGASGSWTRWLSDVTYLESNFGLGGRPVSLTDGQTYYLRVRGKNNTTTTSWFEAANGTLIDRTLPSVEIISPSRSSQLDFSVAWTGSSGSGLAGYDIQYKVGPGGAWTDWLTDTTLTTAVFGAGSATGGGVPINTQDGQTYYFRARAKDNAGKTGPWQSSSVGQSQTTIVLGSDPSTYDPALFGKIKEGLTNRFIRTGDILSSRQPQFNAYLPVTSSASASAKDGTVQSTTRLIYDPETVKFYLNGRAVYDGDSANAAYDHFDIWTGEAVYAPKSDLATGTYDLMVAATTVDGQAMTPIRVGQLKILSAGAAGLAEGTIPLTWPHPYNPDNGDLKFTYSLASSPEGIIIKVLDPAARLIWQKSFYSDEAGCFAGYNEVSWNGRTSWGEALANGVYFYFIETRGTGSQVIGKGKIVVLR